MNGGLSDTADTRGTRDKRLRQGGMWRIGRKWHYWPGTSIDEADLQYDGPHDRVKS